MWRAYRTGSGKAPAGEARYYVESLGVPHTAIDVILVDAESVAFDQRLEGGERLAVYPVFERFDVKGLIPLRGPVYYRVLERIEESGYRVFGRRLGLSFGEKVGIVARTYLEKSPSWVNMSRRSTA